MKYILLFILCYFQLDVISQAIVSYSIENIDGDISVSSVFDADGAGPLVQDNSTVYLFVPVEYTDPVITSTQGGSWIIRQIISEELISSVCDANGRNVLEITEEGQSNLGSITSGVQEGLFTLSFSGSSSEPISAFDPNGGDDLSSCLAPFGFDNVASIDTDGNAGPAPTTDYGDLSFTPQSAFFPVELIAFHATLLPNQTVQLDWQTATELNNHGFEVERSQDARHWEVIGFVKGQGTTTELQEYRHIDPQPYTGLNYYRLRQIDFDGRHEYLPVRSVRVESGQVKGIRVYPNPIREGALNVNFTTALVGSDATLRILDTNGKALRQVALTGQYNSIAIGQLPAGVYLLEVADGRETWQERLVVQ